MVVHGIVVVFSVFHILVLHDLVNLGEIQCVVLPINDFRRSPIIAPTTPALIVEVRPPNDVLIIRRRPLLTRDSKAMLERTS